MPQPATDGNHRDRACRVSVRKRAVYLTVTMAAMACMLGARDGEASVRAAQQKLSELAGSVRSAAQNSPWWSGPVQAAAPEERPLPGAVLAAPTAAAPPNPGAVAVLPVARPQPLPTPAMAAAGGTPTSSRQAGASEAQTVSTHPRADRLILTELPGARYDGALILTPDGGSPATLSLLVEIGTTPPARRVRVAFSDGAAEETVRLDEVLYGERWYSWNPSEPGEWTLRGAAEAPSARDMLGKLAWLVDPSLIVREVGGQSMGDEQVLGFRAHHVRYGLASVRAEWLQALDLPGIESATVDTWVDAETGMLLALEVEGRGLTYDGRVSVRAHAALREVGSQVEIRRPRVCVEASLPPDVALPEEAVGPHHDCDSWAYTLPQAPREAARAQQALLEATGWSVVEADTAYPDYVVYAKGVRRVVVRAASQGAGSYVLLTVVQLQP